MNYLAIVLKQIGIFGVYMLIGVISVKAHVLDRDRLKVLANIVIKILLPLLIFKNMDNGTTREEFLHSAIILLLTAVLYLILYIAARILGRVFWLKGDKRKLYRACTMFGNTGFMGIPLITSLYPKQGGLYIAMFTVIDQLVIWTLGMYLTSPENSDQQEKSVAKNLKLMINPSTVAILIGVVVVLTGLKLPSFIDAALTAAGSAASPLAMIYLGGAFCFLRIRDYLKKPEIYGMIVVKMLLIPLGIYALLRLIPGLDNSIAVTISLQCGLPCMASLAMMAESQGSDSKYIAGMTFVTTMASIVTLPVLCPIM